MCFNVVRCTASKQASRVNEKCTKVTPPQKRQGRGGKKTRSQRSLLFLQTVHRAMELSVEIILKKRKLTYDWMGTGAVQMAIEEVYEQQQDHPRQNNNINTLIEEVGLAVLNKQAFGFHRLHESSPLASSKEIFVRHWFQGRWRGSREK